MAEDKSETSRRRQTAFLSFEFIITIVIQTGSLLVLGTTAVNKLEARISALESQQVTDARIARIEEKMSTLINNQGELKEVIRDLQAELKLQRRVSAR